MSQFHLLTERRFWPLFWTQFLGAFNDNLFKNALVILIAYRSMTLLGISSATIVVACAGVFIFPFFLFSATAGQLADRYPKWILMRWVKVWEIGVMVLAGVGFATDNLALLLTVLFLMGMQSTFFGPAKYAILPELLDDETLVGGNALVAMATFLAILLGTITGGLVVAGGERWVSKLGLMVVAVAVLGFVTSIFIKKLPAANPDLPVSLNPVKPTIDILRLTRRVHSVFLSVLAISWFWFLGASFLSLLPNFSKDVLAGGETVVTLCLATFCVGIGSGSMLCERLSRRHLELGLVPLGSIGISIFAIDLAFSGWRFVAPAEGVMLTVAQFLAAARWRPRSDRSLHDRGLLGLLHRAIDDLYPAAVGEHRAVTGHRRQQHSQRAADGPFVVHAGRPARRCSIDPWDISDPRSAQRGRGHLHLHRDSRVPPAIRRLVPGQRPLPGPGGSPGATYLPKAPRFWRPTTSASSTALLMSSASPRPVRFIMDAEYARLPILRFLFRDAKVIPIAPAGEDPELLERAYDRIAEELAEGELVCIFPEGGITSDGNLAPFRRGIEQIVARTPVPVVPVALVGLWGSFFSRKGGRAMSRPFRRFWSRVEIRVGEAITPEDVTAQGVAERIAQLGGWDVPEPARTTRGKFGIRNSEFGITDYPARNK